MIGRFSGLTATTTVDGFGYGFVAVDTFTPASNLSVTAQTEHYSENFLTARDDTRFNGQTNSAVGVVYRPLSSTSLTGGVTDRVTAGQAGRLSGFNYGVQYAWGTASPILLGYFRNVIHDSASSLGRFDMTRYSVDVPNMNRHSFSLHYAEMHHGPNLVRDLMAVAGKRLRWGHFSAHTQFQFGLIHRHGVDWMLNWGRRNTYLLLGTGLHRSGLGKAYACTQSLAAASVSGRAGASAEIFTRTGQPSVSVRGQRPSRCATRGRAEQRRQSRGAPLESEGARLFRRE